MNGQAMRGIVAVVLFMAGIAGLSACATPTDVSLIRVEDRAVAGAVAVPASLQIRTGDEVRWSNVGARGHQITGGLSNGDMSAPQDTVAQWGPETIAPGQTLARRFDESGVYLYWFGDGASVGVIIVDDAP